jgi:hypothetical protein
MKTLEHGLGTIRNDFFGRTATRNGGIHPQKGELAKSDTKVGSGRPFLNHFFGRPFLVSGPVLALRVRQAESTFDLFNLFGFWFLDSIFQDLPCDISDNRSGFS